MFSNRLWVPTQGGETRGFWIPCIEQNQRDKRPIGSYDLAPGTMRLGVGSGPFMRLRSGKLMFKCSSGWRTWEDQGRLVHLESNSGSDSSEGEGGERGVRRRGKQRC